MSNENVHPIFKSILDTINPELNQQKKFESSVYEKAAIKAHTNDVLSGKFPYLHMTPENEETYIRAFLVGATYGMDVSIGILKKEEAPTVHRQTNPL